MRKKGLGDEQIRCAFQPVTRKGDAAETGTSEQKGPQEAARQSRWETARMFTETRSGRAGQIPGVLKR